MILVGKQFTFNKARNIQTDEALERELRRKGHRLKIINLENNSPLLYEYADGSGYLRTSIVQKYTYENGVLGVSTMNTYYEFLEV